jgi:site-specific DNA recombinase
MIAAVYCRVSTEEQGVTGTSLDSQQDACLKKATELGYTVPDSLIFRESFSGLTLDRPLFNMLRTGAKRGDFGAVIAYGPDRLSRKGEDILTVVAELKLSGVKLVCVQREFDDSFTGKMIAFVLGWASELEASQIKERTMRGKRSKAASGSMPQGTGKGLYGYGLDRENKRRFPIDAEVKVVNMLFTMIAEGDSLFKAAKTLNDAGITTKHGSMWHPLSIKRLITNTAFIGKTYFGKTRQNGKKSEVVPEDEWIMMPDVTPAIVDDYLFQQANRALAKSRLTNRGRPQNDYLLTGHVSCDKCGTHLVGTCLNKQYRYYRCRCTYPTSVSKPTCDAGYIRADQIEELVWEKVKEVIEHPKLIMAEVEKRAEVSKSGNTRVEKEVARMQKKIATNETQQQRLLTLFGNGGIDQDAVLDKLSHLKKEKQEYVEQANRLSKSIEQRIDITEARKRIDQYCKRVKDNLDKFSLQSKKRALNALDVQVMAAPEKVKIRVAVALEFTTIERTSA